MPQSNYKARAVRKKSREVSEYHRDVERPGKPLFWIIPGGLLSLAALVAIICVAHQTWLEHAWEEPRGIAALVLLLPVYIGSVFTFSYGYELYDVDRALKLTGWIVGLTIGIVVVVGVLFCLLSGEGGNSGSGKSKGKSSSGGKKSSSSSGSWFSSSGSHNSSSAPLSIDLNLFSNSSSAATEPTPVEVPPPQPIVCRFCQSEFIPENTDFKCPSCGGPSSRSESDESA